VCCSLRRKKKRCFARRTKKRIVARGSKGAVEKKEEGGAVERMDSKEKLCSALPESAYHGMYCQREAVAKNDG
jgi:hypothetical protein